MVEPSLSASSHLPSDGSPDAPPPTVELLIEGQAAVGPFRCRLEVDPDAADLTQRAVVRVVDARGRVVRQLRPTALEAASDSTVSELVARGVVERERLDAAWRAVRADAAPLARRPADPPPARRRAPRFRALREEPPPPPIEWSPGWQLAGYILMGVLLLASALSPSPRRRGPFGSYRPTSSFSYVEPVRWDRPEWRAFLRDAHARIAAEARRAKGRPADERYPTPEELGLLAPAGTQLLASRTPTGFTLVLRGLSGEDVLCGVRGGKLPPPVSPGSSRPELPYPVARSEPGSVVCWPAEWDGQPSIYLPPIGQAAPAGSASPSRR